MNILEVKVERVFSSEDCKAYCLLEVLLGEGRHEAEFVLRDKKLVAFESCMDQKVFAAKLRELADMLDV